MDKVNRENFAESQIPWMQDAFPTQSTNLPEIIEEETNQITTVVIFVISAILTITLLFVIAVFIDCRQEKLKKLKPKRPKKIRVGRLNLPRMVGRAVRDDESTLADKMEVPQPSTSTVVV